MFRERVPVSQNRVPGLGIRYPCPGTGLGDRSWDRTPCPGTNPCTLGWDPMSWDRTPARCGCPGSWGQGAGHPFPNPGRISPCGVPCPAQPRPPGTAVGSAPQGWLGWGHSRERRAGWDTSPWEHAAPRERQSSAGRASAPIPGRISVLAVPGGVSGAHRESGQRREERDVRQRPRPERKEPLLRLCPHSHCHLASFPLRRSGIWGSHGSGKTPGRTPTARLAPRRGIPPAAVPGEAPPQPPIPESLNP